ncbi:MAG TPA: HEAT repeat domain-containing protein [Blastocatellia bacterium]|nr:HEAT repeat domain-containing protein [Blastocatellia bacterium]
MRAAQAPATQTPAVQASASQASSDQQDQLVNELTIGGLEQRMDTLVRLGLLLTACPGTITDSTVKALVHILRRDQSPVVRALAVRTLELGEDSRVVPHLLGAAKNESQVPVRKAIAYALARYPSSSVTLSLISMLQDKNQEVRAAATYALAESGDSLALSTLIEVLRKRKGERDTFARSEAARGLGRIGSREALPSLLKALTDDDSPDVRREAAIALGKVATGRDTEAIEALREATLTSDPYLTIAADGALASIKTRPD